MSLLDHTRNLRRELHLSELPWMPEDLIKNLSSIVLMIREELETELSHIGLYGSWQRGDAKSTSDVDIVVFLNHEVSWFDPELGITSRSDAKRDRFRWHTLEQEVNRRGFDFRLYSISVVTQNMVHYYFSKGPIHLQNWAYALMQCHLLWKDSSQT